MDCRGGMVKIERYRVFRTVAFWTALIVSGMSLLAVMTAAIWALIYVGSHSGLTKDRILSLVLTYGILLTVASAIFLGIFYGWRVERREARALLRSTKELQRAICRLEQQIGSAQHHQDKTDRL